MTPPTDQPLNLDQIEAVIAAATPGPWGVYEYGGDSLIEIAADLEDTGTGYRARRTVCRLDEEPLDNDPAHREWTAEEDWAQVQADAAYIAAMSPEAAKAMAAEIRRLRAELAAANAQLDATARLAGRQETKLRELGAPATVDAMSVTSDPEPGTRPCGHDDYHDPHEWGDRPGVWCPGNSYADDQAAARP